MSERKYYHIGRFHDEDFEPKDITAPDYYPLTCGEIEALLLAAQQTSDGFEISSIEMRLCQGIWAHTSCVALHSSVAYAIDQVSSLYRRNYRRGPSSGLVDELYRWMLYPFHAMLVLPTW